MQYACNMLAHTTDQYLMHDIIDRKLGTNFFLLSFNPIAGSLLTWNKLRYRMSQQILELAEEISRMFDVVQVEIALLRDGLQQKFQLVLVLRVDDGVVIVAGEELCEMLGHLLEDGFRVKVDKLLPADGVHAIDVARVRPVAVVYRGKRDPFVMTV